MLDDLHDRLAAALQKTAQALHDDGDQREHSQRIGGLACSVSLDKCPSTSCRAAMRILGEWELRKVSG